MKVVFVASGVILAVLGIVGIVVGAILPNIVEDQITQGMEEALPRDVEDAEIVCPGSCEPSTKPNDIYVFNITNAKDVLDSAGAKPIVSQHKFSFTVRQTDYAMDYDAKTDSIGKRTLTQYSANNEADYDTEFITINPVYVGAVAGAAGSEGGLIFGLFVPGVLQKLGAAIGDIAGAVAMISVGQYFQVVMQFCIAGAKPQIPDGLKPGACAKEFNGGNVTNVSPNILAQLTGTQNAMEGTYNASYGADIKVSVAGFSLGAPVNETGFLPHLTSNDSVVGLQSATACQSYVGAASLFGGNYKAAYAAALENGATSTEAFDAALMAGVASVDKPYETAVNATAERGGVLSISDYVTVLQYFLKVAQDNVFKAEVLSAVAVGGDAKSLNDGEGLRWKEPVNTWEDLIYSHFGSGALGDYSLGPIIKNPVFEFYASQLGNAAATRVTITGQEAKLLFDDVTPVSDGADPVFSVGLYCGLMKKVSEIAVGGGNPTGMFNMVTTIFGKYGAKDQASIMAMGGYLCKYVHVKYFNPAVLDNGVLRADGTNKLNTGLFVRRTLREIMHGFDDYMLTVLQQPQSFDGLLSQGADNVTAAEAKDKADGYEGKKDRQVAGTKDNLDEIDHWVEVQGLKSIEFITDLGEDCPPTAVYNDPESFAYKCQVWGEKEQIAGVPDTRWPPLNEDTPVEDFKFYVHDLKRSVKVEKDEEEVELHKIRMVRYRILDSEDKRPEDVKGAEAKKRAENYLPPMSGFIDLQRAQGMAPILIGFPRHSASEAEAGKIVGLTKEDWEETEDDLSTYFDVEPLTGVMMGAHKRLQYNMLLKQDNFNANPYYENVTDDQMAFPILWLDDYNFISEEDAASVNEAIFDVRTQMKTVSLVAIIISVVNCVAGAALVLIGMKSDAAGELSNRS